jgi:hypothetical protein
VSGPLFLLPRLISLTASVDLTVVGGPAPNLTSLAAFDHSLLSIIHLSELVLCFPVIFTVAINDNHSLIHCLLPTCICCLCNICQHIHRKLVVLASKDDKSEFSFNEKEMNVILSGLAEDEFVKVMQLDSAKEMWYKLIISYEGNEKVKDAKLQTYRLKFEQLNMNEDEIVNTYFLRVEDFVNAMKGHGQKIEDSFLVQKILRSLPNIFDQKVSAIEELNDLKVLSIDQLQGTVTAYEMSIIKYKPTSREESFKEDKNEDFEHDEIEAKFMRRLKKGSGKYQVKFPFKCINYGNIGHFGSKCLHKNKEQNYESEEKYKSKRFGKTKSLCVNNDDSS